MTIDNEPTTGKTINQRIADLTQEVEWFYGDDFSLDQAVPKYREALAHAKSIQKDLSTIKNEIIKIEQDFTKSES